MAPPTARGSPVAAAPAPPRTVARRGVPRAAISTRWGQWCAAQRHSNDHQRRAGAAPSRSTQRNSHWRSGALRSALDGLGLKIRRLRKPDALSFGGLIIASHAHRRLWFVTVSISNVTIAAALHQHPRDATAAICAFCAPPGDAYRSRRQNRSHPVSLLGGAFARARTAVVPGRRRGSSRAG